MIDFATLERPGKPNTALRADSGDCPAAADGPSVPMACAPAEAIARWYEVVNDQPRTSVVSYDPAAGTLHAVQSSKLFGFKDDIYAKAVADGEGASRLVLYSASRTGYSDMGVNAKRLDDWVAAAIAKGA